jgi:hypothetical protein
MYELALEHGRKAEEEYKKAAELVKQWATYIKET